MSTMENNINFVQEVEKYPVLYDYTRPNYSRKHVVEKAWADVGRKFQLTGKESKDKWQNLRNAFVKNLKPPASGSSVKKKKTYYLSEAMQFALPFIKLAGTPSGSLPKVPGGTGSEVDLALESSMLEQEEPAEDLNDDEMSQMPPISPPPLPPTPPPQAGPSSYNYENLRSIHEEPTQRLRGKKQRAVAGLDVETGDTISQYFLAKKNYLQSKQQEVTPHAASGHAVPGQSEALKMFLLSLIPDLETLNPCEIRKFKRKMLALIEELVDGQAGYAPLSVDTSTSASSIVLSIIQSPMLEGGQASEVREQRPPTPTENGDSEIDV